MRSTVRRKPFYIKTEKLQFDQIKSLQTIGYQQNNSSFKSYITGNSNAFDNSDRVKQWPQSIPSRIDNFQQTKSEKEIKGI